MSDDGEMTGEVGPMESVTIGSPNDSDCARFLERVVESRSFHGSWVSPPADEGEFAAYLRRVQRIDHRGFLVRSSGEIAGVININNIVMGAFRSGHLGYYAFSGYQGSGVMTRGLRLVMDAAFGDLGLHRLEANIQPGNLASIRLVQRAGFSKEGFSPDYLLVDGEWRDHERWAIISDRPVD
jgi:ribosomal-protein-alanine N-acetyltransferase